MKEDPDWEVLLDVDELAKKDGVSWVWKGSVSLPKTRDDPEQSENGKIPTRVFTKLSDGGADAVHIREFCLKNKVFVSDLPNEEGKTAEFEFKLPEAKTRINYKSRDVVFVGSDFGPGSMTDSGYPRTVREWVRGTKVDDAPVIFEGEKSDISVSVYIDDERFR